MACTTILPSAPTGTAATFGRIAGPPKSTIRNITLKDLDLTLASETVVIEQVEGLKIENAKINGKPLESLLKPPGAK